MATWLQTYVSNTEVDPSLPLLPLLVFFSRISSGCLYELVFQVFQGLAGANFIRCALITSKVTQSTQNKRYSYHEDFKSYKQKILPIDVVVREVNDVQGISYVHIANPRHS